MDKPPTPQEADAALRQIRQQQADAVRNAYKPGPWWAYAVLTAFFVSYGLGQDLHTVWGPIFQILSWMILAGAAWVQWRRRQIKQSVTAAWRMNDAVTWIATFAFIALALAVLFGGPLLLASFGLPFPHAICGLAVGLMMVAIIPFGRWTVDRAVARIESGEL
jgi:hypothetical protein